MNWPRHPFPVTTAVDVVRIRRGEWDVSVIADRRGRYDFMQRGPLFDAGNARLDSIFSVGDVPYRWRRLERRYLEAAPDIVAVSGEQAAQPIG